MSYRHRMIGWPKKNSILFNHSLLECYWGYRIKNWCKSKHFDSYLQCSDQPPKNIHILPHLPINASLLCLTRNFYCIMRCYYQDFQIYSSWTNTPFLVRQTCETWKLWFKMTEQSKACHKIMFLDFELFCIFRCFPL